MSRSFKKLSVVTASVSAFALASVGCTSAQPVYGPGGQVVRYEHRDDPGKTLGGFGDVVLGLVPFGKDAKAARDVAMMGRTLQTVGNATRQD